MAKRATPQPIAPRFDTARSPATLDDLADPDRQWARLDVADADLAGVDLDGAMINACRIVSTSLSGADLQRSRLVDVVFVDCDLSGVALHEAVLTRVEFRNCRLSGTALNSCRTRDVLMVDSKADGISVRAATLERTTFERTLMRSADFGLTRFAVTRFFDCDLTSSDFSKTSFTDVRMHGSDLGDLRGIEHMRGIVIDPQQMHAFALSLLAAQRVEIDEDREPQAMR